MKIRFFIALAAIVILVFPVSAPMAQEVQPGDACTTANRYIVSGGPENSGKVYHMTCQGGVWVLIYASDTSGHIGIGTDTPQTMLSLSASGAERGIRIDNANNSAGWNPFISGNRARGTIGSPATLQNNDVIFEMMGWGYSNGGYRHASYIGSYVDAAPSGGDMPTRMEFQVQRAGSNGWMGDGSSVPEMVIKSDGKIGIGTAAPAATLHVAGEAIIGDTGLACTAGAEGALRYIAASDDWEFCNGSAWVPFEQAGPAGCGPANGLVGHWTLDETSSPSVDSSASGNDGTWANSPTSATGKLGNALDFSGNTGSTATNDRVAIGDPADGSLDFGATSFSYGMWVYVTATAGGFDFPLWKGTAGGPTLGYSMALGSGSWQSFMGDSSLLVSRDFSAAPILNQWVHLFTVADRRNESFRVYVNGSLISSVSIPNGLGSVSNTNAMQIGAFNLGNDPFLGKIDDVRIYDCAMTDAEVLALYNTYP